MSSKTSIVALIVQVLAVPLDPARPVARQVRKNSGIDRFANNSTGWRQLSCRPTIMLILSVGREPRQVAPASLRLRGLVLYHMIEVHTYDIFARFTAKKQ
jgi:hypothetical protein